MPSRTFPLWLRRLGSDYGMLGVLALLAAFYSVATWAQQEPVGEVAADQLLRQLTSLPEGPQKNLLVAVRSTEEDRKLAELVVSKAKKAGWQVLEVVQGEPPVARQALVKLQASGTSLSAIACNRVTAKWPLWENLETKFPQLGSPAILQPQIYYWPDFLKSSNLLNVANQMAVVAIMAIGMTLVIITGGIDLSVGSLVALSAVVAALLIRNFGGAEQAPVLALILCSLAAIALCAACGLFSGSMVTLLNIPPFIVTLGMMLVASGLALKLSNGESINQIPESYMWLGRGSSLGIPHAVILMIGLYALAHVMMTRFTLGRYLYAVGGNIEATRLSGVPIQTVRIIAYALCGASAGLGGVILASQYKSSTPTLGKDSELYVIAAVVVGGTSIAGGEGRVLNSLIGALIIAVNNNGMNLLGMDGEWQRVVLGAVILGAVVLDRVWRRR